MIAPPVSAESETIGNSDYTISTTLDGTIDINIQPSTAGSIATDSQNLTISTTCPAGYDLYIHMDGEDNKLHRIPQTADELDYYFSPTTGTIDSPSTLENNQWGFNTNNSTTSFSQVPVTSELIKTITDFSPSDLSTSGDYKTTTTFTYGIKADTNIPSGDYLGTVVYSVIPDPLCAMSAFERAYYDNNKETTKAPDGKDYYKMQDMNMSICDAVPTPDKTIINVPEITLIDTRDNELYTVRKLADGNCWMTDNLRLQLSTSKPLTPEDSDVFSNWTPTYDSQTSTGTIWGGNAANEARSYVDIVNKEYGGYYNWYAATAGSGTYEMDIEGTNAASSICPKGWRLPEGGTSMDKSFGNLTTAHYGTSSQTSHGGTILNPPLSIVLSGYYNYGGGSVVNAGSYTILWSSTVGDTNYAYYMYVDSSLVNPQDSRNKANGISVRCVARDDPENTSELTQAMNDANAETAKASDGNLYYTMQSMTPEICGKAPTPSARNADNTINANVPEATLIDKRDNKTYVVRKLADGNCWMAQNLDLDLAQGVTLTSELTDIGYGGSGRTSFTPEHSTQTETGIVWAKDGADGARSYDAGDKYLINNTTVSNTVGSNGQVEHVGNYYNFPAATAGQGTPSFLSSRGFTDTTDSICPKGWMMPTYHPEVKEKSFQNLLFAITDVKDNNTNQWRQESTGAGVYGLVFTNSWDDFDVSAGSLDPAVHKATIDALAVAPFNFTSTGWYEGSAYIPSLIRLRSATGHNTSSNSINSVMISIDLGRVYLLANDVNGRGYPVRCVNR